MKVKVAIVIAATVVIALGLYLVMQPVERVYIQPNGAIIKQNRITGNLALTSAGTIQREKYEAHKELEVERVIAFTEKDSSLENITYVKYNEENEYRLSGRLNEMEEVVYCAQGEFAVPQTRASLSGTSSEEETPLNIKSNECVIVDAGYDPFFIRGDDLSDYLDLLPPRTRKNLLKQFPEMADYAKEERARFRWKCLLYFIGGITISFLVAAAVLVAKKTRNKNRPAS